MPFEETQVMDPRQRFVHDVHRSLLSISELCRRYQISRKTGYKWLGRWEEDGPAGLRDRTRRPSSSPRVTPPEVVEAILGVRKKHSTYGAKRVAWYLERHQPDLVLPSRTTIHNILHRQGLVPKRRRRVRRWHPGRNTTEKTRPLRTYLRNFNTALPVLKR